MTNIKPKIAEALKTLGSAIGDTLAEHAEEMLKRTGVEAPPPRRRRGGFEPLWPEPVAPPAAPPFEPSSERSVHYRVAGTNVVDARFRTLVHCGKREDAALVAIALDRFDPEGSCIGDFTELPSDTERQELRAALEEFELLQAQLTAILGFSGVPTVAAMVQRVGRLVGFYNTPRVQEATPPLERL